MVINSRNGLFIVALLTLMPQIKVCIANGNGEFAFASYYGDHMVLQRGPQQAIAWGYGPSPGSNVTVLLSGKTPITVKVDSGNTWKVKLAAISDTIPHTITATSSAGTIMLKDVLFGDVWICSGQSNMQFTLSQAFNATEEIADSVNYPNIRVFTASMKTSDVPLSDLSGVEEVWSIPSKDTIGAKAWTYFSAVCWLYGKRLYGQLKYPIGLVASTWGGTPVEAWSDPATLKKCGIQTEDHKKLRGPGSHSVLWNAMMHPLTNMTIYGAVWYQGEANAGKPDTYNCTFPSMIDSWRQYFSTNSEQQTDSQFPFGFVQLAANRNDPSAATGFPDIRWHQTADYGYVPNDRMSRVFMATAMDLPDFQSTYGSVHPRDKQDVADRLLLSGMAVAYGKTDLGKFNGPYPTKMNIDPSEKSILVTYDQESSEIEVRETNGFEVCCSQMNITSCNEQEATWVPAPIKENDKYSVTVSYSGCASKYVVAIRYAWRESPCPFKKCAVYSINNSLPAVPFIQTLSQLHDTTLRYRKKDAVLGYSKNINRLSGKRMGFY